MPPQRPTSKRIARDWPLTGTQALSRRPSQARRQPPRAAASKIVRPATRATSRSTPSADKPKSAGLSDRSDVAALDLIDADLDFAMQAGLYIGKVSEKELQHAEDLADEGRPSELQAAATSLDERLRAERDDALRDIETQRCETSRQRLEAMRDVLDQGEVEAKMHLVADFARHLKRINEQRAQLLARAKEPVAVEHILVDRNHHRYLVDSTSWMSRLIRTLPELAEMLRFLLSFDLRNLAGTQQGEGEADQSSGAEGMVARLEQFVYEVEQAQSWAESEKPSAHTSGGKLPRFIMAKPKKQ